MTDFSENIFVKGKWVVCGQDNEQTKVAACEPDETFNKTHDNWQVLPKNNKDHKEISTLGQKTQKYKPPYDKVISANVQFNIGFYLIRDLLNMEKINNLSKTFLADGVPLSKVIVCARILSIERKNQHYRLILNDGTSSILCLTKISEESECSHLRNKAIQFGIRIQEEEPHYFDNTFLGRSVKVIGHLKEYMNKNFIFAHHIRFISDQGFVDFMDYVISLYEFKRNIVLE